MPIATTKKRFALLLRKHGLKATPRRLLLLTVLAMANRPLSIGTICAELKGDLNATTVYRALEALADIGIVRRVNMGHGHADYELTDARRHHHHLICKQCDKIEDVNACGAKELERLILKKSNTFATIDEHALEFFGLCKQCAA